MDKTLIKELEEQLRRISFARPEYGLPALVPDGIYGSETEKAVGVMQKRAGLLVTGRPDAATVDAIRGEYLLAEADSSPGKPISPFPYPRYRAKVGERSEFVLLLSAVLRAIAGRYDACAGVGCGDLYDERVKNAVSEFQRVNMLPVTGETDKATWDRLADEFDRLFCNKCSDG